MARSLRVSSVCLALVLLLNVAVFAAPASTSTNEDRPHFVQVHPDAAKALKKQGRAFKYPFPNSANQGRKFVPGGEVIPPLNVTGNLPVLVLFVDFADTPPGAPTTRRNLQEFDDLLFGTTYWPPEYDAYKAELNTYIPANRTMKNFYAENSYGKVNITTFDLPTTVGWIKLAKPYSYYGANNGFNAYPSNAQGLIVDAVKAADANIDFSKYAVNGVLPNLLLVFAGSGAEWSGTPELIWSHSWDLDGPTGGAGLKVDGVTVSNYAMMPEVGGDLTGFLGTKSGPFPATVGVFAHEFAHVLGLPDEYDYGYDSEGVGPYSMMGGGSWNTYPNRARFSGNSPSHFDAWSKYRLGFVEVKEITASTSGTFELPPVETSPVIYKMVVPNSGGKEYYLFENRQQIGFDEGLIPYGSHGLAIYHIDDVVLTRTYWRPNEAQNDKEFRSLGNQKASNGEKHYGISIIQADDRWDLERGTYGVTAGDLYPGSFARTELSSNTFPNTSSYYFWAGSVPSFGWSGVTVKNIAEKGGNITADFMFIPKN